MKKLKPRLPNVHSRDSHGNISYNCPYCKYEHWHPDWLAGCPDKFCSQCGGEYEREPTIP